MTIIIGAKILYKGTETVIMGADAGKCYYVDGKEEPTIRKGSKFIYQPGAPWLLAHSGTETSMYQRFKRHISSTPLRVMRTHDTLCTLLQAEPLELCFDEIGQLIIDECDEDPDDPKSSFFFAGSFAGRPHTGLFTDTGALVASEVSEEKPFTYFTYGSGQDYADIGMSIKEKIAPGEQTPALAAQCIVAALRYAQHAKDKRGKTVRATNCKGYQIAVATNKDLTVSPLFSQKEYNSFLDYCWDLMQRVHNQLGLPPHNWFKQYESMSFEDVWSGLIARAV